MCNRFDRRRAALTLVELMAALTVTALVVGALSALARGVQISSGYCQDRNDAVQHARVAFERIDRNVQGAYASESFPGAAVLSAYISNNRFPNMLVIWRPSGTPVNAAGPPLINELVIYCTSPSSPNQLLEVTDSTNSTALPTSSAPAMRTALDSIVQNSTSKKVIVSDLLRTFVVGSGANSTQGAARFEIVVTPSLAEVASFRAGTTTWKNLSWPQFLYGQQTGTRQVWVRTELQLNSGTTGGVAGNSQDVLPFLGSSSLLCELQQ